MRGRCAGDGVLVDAGDAHHPDRQGQLPLPLRERMGRPRRVAQAQLEGSRGRCRHRHRHRECCPIGYLYVITSPIPTQGQLMPLATDR